MEIGELKYEPYYLMPAKPFKIIVTIYDHSDNVSDNVLSNVSDDVLINISGNVKDEEKQINTTKSFKSNECVISLTHYHTTNFRLFQTERVCRRQFQI